MTTRAGTTPPRRRGRLSAAVGIVVFLLLAGTGVASAAWTTASSTLSASVTAGQLAVTQTGVAGLAMTYSPSALVDFSPITVRNTGTVPASYTYALKASATNSLSSAVTVVAWSVTSAAQCTATAPTVGTITATLANGITAPSMSLGVNQTAFFCVRTSVTSQQATTLTGTTTTAVGTLASSVGSWTSQVAASAQQSVANDTVAPTAPTNLAASSVTANQVTLGWTASTDTYGVAGYRVYRAGIAIATVTGLTYTNTGLIGGTTYNYTVRAFDAAGNESPNSNAVTVTTPATAYRIAYRNGLCLAGENGGTASGTKLVIATCATVQSQVWQFTPTSDGYFKIVPANATALSWTTTTADGLATTQDYAKTALVTYSGQNTQQWMPVSNADGTTVRFVNRLSGKCLDVNGQSTTAGTQLQQYTCNGTAAQNFTRTEVN